MTGDMVDFVMGDEVQERYAMNGGYVYHDQGSISYIDCPRKNAGLFAGAPRTLRLST